MKRTCRLLATRTVNRRVITTAWLAFEKCPVVLDKLFQPRLCFKLRHLLFECIPGVRKGNDGTTN